MCKLDYHRGGRAVQCKRGYIAMLAVDERHRKRRIGSTLVRRAIRAMQAQDADEVSGIKHVGTCIIDNQAMPAWRPHILL